MFGEEVYVFGDVLLSSILLAELIIIALIFRAEWWLCIGLSFLLLFMKCLAFAFVGLLVLRNSSLQSFYHGDIVMVIPLLIGSLFEFLILYFSFNSWKKALFAAALSPGATVTMSLIVIGFLIVASKIFLKKVQSLFVKIAYRSLAAMRKTRVR